MILYLVCVTRVIATVLRLFYELLQILLLLGFLHFLENACTRFFHLLLRKNPWRIFQISWLTHWVFFRDFLGEGAEMVRESTSLRTIIAFVNC